MRFVKRCAALAVLLAVAAMPAALAVERAAVTVYAGGVDFLPTVNYASARLTVSGNGVTFSRAIERGGALSIDLFDPNGQLLPDGVYRWQLDLVPNEATAARLRTGEAERWETQSGSFAIRGGAIADQSLAEAGDRSASGPRPGVRSGFASGSFAASRGPAEDDDAAVGSRVGVEAQVNDAAAAARQAPTAGTGILQQPDRAPSDRSDAVTAALGRSIEHNNQLPAQPRGVVPQPRSDGSNGRPRS